MIQVPVWWEVKNLGKYLKLKSGDTKPEDTSEHGYYEVYGGNGVTGYSNHKNNDLQTLIIGRVGEYCGSVFLVDECWITDNALYIEKFLINLNILYMYYLLDFLNLNQYKAETGQPLLNQTIIGNLEVKLPKEIKEQEKIAKILSTLDNAIESTNRIIEKEKNIKTALVQELLTNGIDKNGQIRTPQTHTYKQSELGLIPDEWEVDSIENHAKIITGDKDTQDRLDDGEYPFYVRSQTIERINTYSFDGEAVLTAGDGVGVGKVFHFVNEKFDFHQRVYCIHDFSEKLNSSFFFEYFRTYFIEQVNKYSAKGSVDSVRYDMIALMNIPLPTFEEQKQIAKILTTQDKKIEIEETNLDKLKELKKGLMNDLLSGVVRVKV